MLKVSKYCFVDCMLYLSVVPHLYEEEHQKSEKWVPIGWLPNVKVMNREQQGKLAYFMTVFDIS